MPSFDTVIVIAVIHLRRTERNQQVPHGAIEETIRTRLKASVERKRLGVEANPTGSFSHIRVDETTERLGRHKLRFLFLCLFSGRRGSPRGLRTLKLEGLGTDRVPVSTEPSGILVDEMSWGRSFLFQGLSQGLVSASDDGTMRKRDECAVKDKARGRKERVLAGLGRGQLPFVGEETVSSGNALSRFPKTGAEVNSERTRRTSSSAVRTKNHENEKESEERERKKMQVRITFVCLNCLADDRGLNHDSALQVAAS